MKYLNSRTPGEILISHEKRDESNRQETLASVWSMTAVVFEKGSSDNETRPTNSIDSFMYEIYYKRYSYCVSSCSLFLIETADEARVSNWSLYTIDNQLMHAILHVR